MRFWKRAAPDTDTRTCNEINNAAILAEPCQECGAPAGQSCVLLALPSLGAVRLKIDYPPLIAHITRIRAAIASGRVEREAVRSQFIRNEIPAGI